MSPPRQEVEADRQQARAAGSDEARVSKCVRYRRSPSPPQEQPDGSRRAGREQRDGAGFLRDRARDGAERGAERGGGRGERDRRKQQQPPRKEDVAWRLERQQIDQRRVERSKTSDGSWRREWDREKKPAEARRCVRLESSNIHDSLLHR